MSTESAALRIPVEDLESFCLSAMRRAGMTEAHARVTADLGMQTTWL